MTVAEARRYSRKVGLSSCDSVTGTPGRRLARSSPSRRSCSGLTMDHKQADADGLDLQRLEPLDDREDRCLIERLQHLALGVNALGDLKCQAARHIGLGIGDAEVERLDAAALANDEHVAMPLGRQKRGLGGRAGEDRVDRPRGAVNEGGRARRASSRRGDAIMVRRQLDRVQHAANRIVRRRRGLEELNAITVLDHRDR